MCLIGKQTNPTLELLMHHNVTRPIYSSLIKRHLAQKLVWLCETKVNYSKQASELGWITIFGNETDTNKTPPLEEW